MWSMKKATMKKNQRAFTLIEVMVVVALIAILASVALPAYTDHIRKAKRASAASALMDLAAKQQAYLIDRREFSSSTTDLRFSPPSDIASDFDFSEIDVDNTASPPTFTVKAKPISAQMLADRCGISATVPMALRQDNTKSPLACWQK